MDPLNRQGLQEPLPRSSSRLGGSLLCGAAQVIATR
jgi:hypothetical protein